MKYLSLMFEKIPIDYCLHCGQRLPNKKIDELFKIIVDPNLPNGCIEFKQGNILLARWINTNGLLSRT